MSIVMPMSAARAGGAPVELVDTAETPDGGRLYLLRCGAHYSIEYDEGELMGSEAFASEEALASLAIGHVEGACERVLIGGLGMGFTLRAALPLLAPGAAVTVAELVPKVLAWAHGPLAHLYGETLADPRVTVELVDVHARIAATPAGGFDAILLDVDNGPDGFIHLANDRLYCDWGLREARAALRPGGVLAIWSAYRDDAFAQRLADAGFATTEMHIPDPEGRTRPPYIVWLAARR